MQCEVQSKCVPVTAALVTAELWGEGEQGGAEECGGEEGTGGARGLWEKTPEGAVF